MLAAVIVGLVIGFALGYRVGRFSAFTALGKVERANRIAAIRGRNKK